MDELKCCKNDNNLTNNNIGVTQLISLLGRFKYTLRVSARLHWASASILWQCYDDASNTALIENNGVTQKWVSTPFWGDSIVFNENSIANVTAALHWRWRLL